jgi:hypothetical protein
MTTCSDATARWDGAAAGRESVKSDVRTTSNVHAGEVMLVAGSGDQRRRRYGPKGRRSGSPMLEWW